MYLSRLVLNLRHTQARRDLANPYEMHSTLSWAFGKPPQEGSPRFLWRLESMRADRLPVALVQSHAQPRWDAIQERFPGYLTKPAKVKEYRLLDRLRTGQVLRFRLRANPTVTRNRKRRGLRRPADQIAWLHRQGERHGFSVLGCTPSQPGLLRARQREGGNVITVQVVTYDGFLRVKDHALLRGVLASGLGHAKALGLGLLSVAPARE